MERQGAGRQHGRPATQPVVVGAVRADPHVVPAARRGARPGAVGQPLSGTPITGVYRRVGRGSAADPVSTLPAQQEITHSSEEALDMSSYPGDFPIPVDQGGPGAGQRVGGFGGNAATGREEHRQAVQRIGKAPVLLVHGNGGAADTGRWDMLDLRRMLLAAGYSDELIWAPSYLGSGVVDLLTPHTDNVGELRDFLDAVCAYLDVDVVDVIAHSLGCSLTYAVCRGLERHATPVDWGERKHWQRLGTFVALAGAFHGLGSGGLGEWRTGGEFTNELLAETLGDGGEDPFGAGKEQTPPPTPHNITYFCGVARGDFIDAQNPGTGLLAGAVNKTYDLGAGLEGHEKIKESQLVFNDFLPLLNRVPPVAVVKLTVDHDSGGYASPLTVRPAVDPVTLGVAVEANRLTKQFANGYILDEVLESRQETLADGQPITLTTAGMWRMTFTAAGAVDDLIRTYWVGVPAVTVTITAPDEPFIDSVLVVAATSDPTARLFHSLDGVVWTEGATVTILEDAAVSFLAINPDGIASAVATRSLTKRLWDATVTASAINHFLAGRIDATGYVTLSQRFGFFTPFALFLVAGEWVLDPSRPAPVGPPSPPGEAPAEATTGGAPPIRVRPADPQPGQHAGPVTVAIEAADAEGPLTVYYSRDGSLPTRESARFDGTAPFQLGPEGNHVIACYAVDHAGGEHYQAIPYTITR